MLPFPLAIKFTPIAPRFIMPGIIAEICRVLLKETILHGGALQI